MSKIKICGLTREEDIWIVNEIMPDYIGFVFANSKRQVSFEQAKKMKKQLSKKIQSVGVFVNEKPSVIAEFAKAGVIDMIQLHGQEKELEIQQLKNMCHMPIIKAVSVKTKEDIEKGKKIKADYILFDNGIGGTGESFDWSLLEDIEKSYFIAGGLDLGNITEALKKNPYAVDVSSGVELDGKKNKQKIKQLVDIVRKNN